MLKQLLHFWRTDHDARLPSLGPFMHACFDDDDHDDCGEDDKDDDHEKAGEDDKEIALFRNFWQFSVLDNATATAASAHGRDNFDIGTGS